MNLATLLLLATSILIQDGPAKSSKLLKQDKALITADPDQGTLKEKSAKNTTAGSNSNALESTGSKPADAIPKGTRPATQPTGKSDPEATSQELETLKKGLVETEKEIAQFEKVVGPKDPILIQLRKKVSQMRASIKLLESLQSKAPKTDPSASPGQSPASSRPATSNSSQESSSTKGMNTEGNTGKNPPKKDAATAQPSVPLNVQISKLKQQWNKATSELEKKEIKKKLLLVLEQQFDLDLKKQDEKLIASERRLAKLRQQFETMVKSKKKIINTYADATTTSWDHPGILNGALGESNQPGNNNGKPRRKVFGGRFNK